MNRGGRIIRVASAIVGATLALAGCENSSNLSADAGIDRKGLESLQAGIWVDPNGCEHWIIDDGVEGYMSERMQKDGKPVCSSTAERMRVQGDFKGGSAVADLF